ncbi:MAG TPA: hypothetical protein ENJ09_11695 [Planctomycetes bacterium]|nr:hypothetical protein [Planctomycetota bacterium]
MQRKRPRLPWILLWLALLFLSLRPVPAARRVTDLVTSPLRVVAELASPITLLTTGRVHAAERRLQDGADAQAMESEALLRDLATSSLPTEPRLLRGRRAVHAEVIGHRDWDHLLLRLHDPRGVRPGMPVAFGNAYVGRIERLARRGESPDLAVVTLVTAASLRVGAIIEEPEREGEGAGAEGEPVRLSVGGVRTGPREHGTGRASVRGLAVFYPSDRAVRGGLVRVRELFADASRYPELSEGLRLGRYREVDGHAYVEPEIDYKDGLFHVVVLAPREDGLEEASAFAAVLFDSNWVRARPINVGDPHPERRTRKVRAGRRLGVEQGAAVTSIGAHLVGRVSRAGLWTSDVALLDDPGFRVVAVARIDGIAEPRVLGRLISKGRAGADGLLRFRWVVRVGLGGEQGRGSAHAHLYTGSGEDGLPPGFSIGEAELPLDARAGEEREILVRPDVDPASVGSFFVRTREPAGGGMP